MRPHRPQWSAADAAWLETWPCWRGWRSFTICRAGASLRDPPTPNRNGGRHCCQPPLRRAKDLPVSMVRIPKNSFPEIQAHQLRRRFPSDNSLRRGDRPFTGPRHPRVRLSFNYRCLAKPKPSDVPRPFLGRPLLRPALLFRPKSSEPRRARGRSTLPAPLPDWPRKSPKSFTLPVGGDRFFRHPPLPSGPCGLSGGGGDFRPDHLLTMHLGSESGKRNLRAQACG